MQTRFDGHERLYQVIRLMRRIDLDLGRIMNAELRRAGLTPAQRAVLEAIHENGAMTVPEVAARLSLKRQFVQRAAARLITAGFIETMPNPTHKRSLHLCLTEAGRSAFSALHERELALLHRHLGDINMTEIIVALRVMNRVAACFSELAAGLARAPMTSASQQGDFRPAAG